VHTATRPDKKQLSGWGFAWNSFQLEPPGSYNHLTGEFSAASNNMLGVDLTVQFFEAREARLTIECSVEIALTP
jgi:hypothetical protein